MYPPRNVGNRRSLQRGGTFVFMNEVERAAEVAQALASPVRLALLTRLLESPATVSELVAFLGESQSLISNHLRYLRERKVVEGERHGRQIRYRLQDPNLADVVEALSAYAGPQLVGSSQEGPLLLARTCYDHLAGALGVEVYQALIAAGGLEEQRDQGQPIDLGPHADAIFPVLGVDPEVARKRRRRFAFACLDWTERRPHLGGALGAAVCARFFDLGWVERGKDRALTVTNLGRRALQRTLGVRLSP
jgi:DNA-binding transcriptional ArsR family regulator